MVLKKDPLVKVAITKGFIIVNGPMFFFLCAPFFLAFLIPKQSDLNSIIGISFIPSFILAWVWWSFSLPKWRLWAVKHVDDVDLLLAKAIGIGLMWPPGHFFQKTEIRSAEEKKELRRELSSKLDVSDEYTRKLIYKLTK